MCRIWSVANRSLSMPAFNHFLVLQIWAIQAKSCNSISNDAAALEKFETVRAYGACAENRFNRRRIRSRCPPMLEVAFVAPAADYTASSSKTVKLPTSIYWCALSMGKLHHAMMVLLQSPSLPLPCAGTLKGSTLQPEAGISTIRQAHCALVRPPNVRTDNGRPQSGLSRSARVI